MAAPQLQVLLVGGEPLVRDAAAAMIASLGHAPAQDGPVDVFIVDVEDPQGLAAIGRLRGHPDTAAAPIVGMANGRNARLLELALQAGASATLRLPFKRQELAAAIQAALR